MQRLFISCLFAIALVVSPAQADQPKAEPSKNEPAKVAPAKPTVEKVLETLCKALNDSSSKDLQPLCSKDVQKALPPAIMELVFRQVQSKFGKLIDTLVEQKPQGEMRVYRARGEKLVFFIKVHIDKDGLLSGLQFTPAMLENLPAGPLTLGEVERRMQEAIEQTLYAQRIPSISVALVKGDQIVWAKAFGCLNMAKSVPADPETVYITGSMFKVVVATAVMQLVDEGKLELDAPVNKYLKGFQVPNAYEKEAPLTVRHLLSHHGGIPNHAQLVNLWTRELPVTIDDLVHKNMKVVTKPGTKYEYSNLAYTFNGYLVGELSGTSFAKAMRKRLFEPLQMTRTVFDPTPSITENLAVPYFNTADGQSIIPAPRVRLDVWPAGDVYGTPSDMARFLIMHLNGGKYNGKQVLSARSVTEMATLQFAKKDEKNGQGLGWMINMIRGRRTLWHNGAVPGFYTQMAIDPAKKTGVVLFSNRYDTLGAIFGVAPDNLIDLRTLAIELLARLETPKATAAK